jgi:hypothetical protein
LSPARRRTQSRRGGHVRLIFAIWAVNLLGMLGLVLFLLANHSGLSAQAADQASASQAAYQAPTPFPTRFYLPTVTPNPRSTQLVMTSPTPFVLLYGQEPLLAGYSVSKRPIQVYTFGQGEKQRMLVAGIHGGYEWNTIALADQLITYLAGHPEGIPADVTLFILRNLNPDGDARDHGIDGRVNDHGVDLNRNFPVAWSSTWDRSGCFDQAPTTSGTGPASEPETRVLIIFPGGDPWDADSMRLAEQLAAVSTYPYPPIQTGCLYSGTLADYAVSRGMAAVDLELSDHSSTDFTMNLRILKVLLGFE